LETPDSPGTDLVQHLDEGAGPDVDLQCETFRVHLRTADQDRLGIMVSAVEFRDLIGTIQAVDLQERLLGLAEVLDYLSEPLCLVEHDPAHTGALMRSSEIRQVGSDRDYFEMRVEMNRDTLFSRFRQPGDGRERSALPFLMTRKNLARLVDDLAACLDA
jgi:hypothetical protein